MILGKAGEVRSVGYNGMPRGCNDSDPSRNQRPEKYFWYEHAERNALYNAARVGTPLEGCTAIVTKFPCMDCMRGLIQSGIVEVMAPYPELVNDQAIWIEQITRTLALIDELGIEVKLWKTLDAD